MSGHIAGVGFAFPPMKKPGVVAIGKRIIKAIRATEARATKIFQAFTIYPFLVVPDIEMAFPKHI